MAVKEIYEAVTGYNLTGIGDLIQKELADGTNVSLILGEGLIAAMDDVGNRFSAGDLYVPEMMLAAKVMQTGLDVIKPLLMETNTQAKGTIVMGTVMGDLHDIGKNLVIMMLEGGGFKVVDLGIDVEPQIFLDAAKEHEAQIVALSALLTTTLPAMEKTVNILKKEGLELKVLVGGAPVRQDFADKIGADGYGVDAPSAVLRARDLIR